jgi:hypothetical protein
MINFLLQAYVSRLKFIRVQWTEWTIYAIDRSIASTTLLFVTNEKLK